MNPRVCPECCVAQDTLFCQICGCRTEAIAFSPPRSLKGFWIGAVILIGAVCLFMWRFA
jgi:hypothetical protein